MSKVMDFIMGAPWAITPEAMEQVLSIAKRTHNMTPEALATQLGRPLENAQYVEMRDRTAILSVRGPIFRYANLFTQLSGATSLEVLAQNFAAADADPNVDLIIQDIDSPGGHSAGISEYAAMVRAAKTPTIAYIGNMAASAAYWIAAASGQVVAADTAMLGSIGVVGTYQAEKDDVIKIISSQSPLKQATPDTPEGAAEAQKVVDDIAAVFIGAVAQYRGVDEKTVIENFGQGGILVGKNAVDAGMVDRLGSLEALIAESAGESDEKNVAIRGISMNENTSQAPDISREFLAENHADLLAEIEAAASVGQYDAGYAKGVDYERERILGVQDQSLAGHEALIQTLMADGSTTPPQAALAVLSAEREAMAAMSAGVKSETPGPVPTAAEGGGSAEDKNAPIEERCKSAWDKSPELRAEFMDLGAYVAYSRADESGRARQIGGKQ